MKVQDKLYGDLKKQIKEEVKSECSEGIKSFYQTVERELNESKMKLATKIDDQLTQNQNRQNDLERAATDLYRTVNNNIGNLRAQQENQRVQMYSTWKSEVDDLLNSFKEQTEKNLDFT